MNQSGRVSLPPPDYGSDGGITKEIRYKAYAEAMRKTMETEDGQEQ